MKSTCSGKGIGLRAAKEAWFGWLSLWKVTCNCRSFNVATPFSKMFHLYARRSSTPNGV